MTLIMIPISDLLFSFFPYWVHEWTNKWMNFSFSPWATCQLSHSLPQVFSFSFVSYQQLCFILTSTDTFFFLFTSSVCSSFTRLLAALLEIDTSLTRTVYECSLWHQSLFLGHVKNTAVLSNPATLHLFYFFSFYYFAELKLTVSALVFFYIIPLLLCNLHLDVFLSPHCELLSVL